ncbi:UDP-N-acetylglucosamine transporter-like [Physella acuta]|uniref:UDP-N-acetylglucosamine transporter-like n=1 Tax=Physella acuta TaxID=109671 RepID=UPI0027DC2689|nr:UDP-N-acetylglucosamine transporter-like [Physella acuta]
MALEALSSGLRRSFYTRKKKCLLEVAEELYPEDVKQFEYVALGANNTALHVADIDENIVTQIVTTANKFRNFSIAMDELLDSCSIFLEQVLGNKLTHFQQCKNFSLMAEAHSSIDEKLSDESVSPDIQIITNGNEEDLELEQPVPLDASTYLKYISLVLLTVQNALLILVMRYVRTREGEMFLSSSAVIMAEIFKFTTSLVVILIQTGGTQAWLKLLYEDIILEPIDCLKVSIPSIIFVLQNNLVYVAISNLDAATFQVSYQLKILTTAIFSVLMLKKVLSKLQWASLVILFVGVAIVQMQPENSKKTATATEQSQIEGLIAVVISSFMSGFASVYFEKILKGSRQSVWIRNVQLGVLGSIMGAITMFVNDGEKLLENGFFHGYDYVVWFVVCLQSLGGLLIAVVVKYADNILKVFATSGAIICSCVASIYFFEFRLSLEFTVGACLVIAAVFIYSKFIPSRAQVLPTASSVDGSSGG